MSWAHSFMACVFGGLLASVVTAAEPEARPDIERLYAQVVKSMGRQYSESRSPLLAEGERAVEFLQATTTVAKDPSGRWLAEILLARVQRRLLKLLSLPPKHYGH